MNPTTSQHFAVLTARLTTTPDGDYRSHYITCGHASSRCPSILPESRRIPGHSLGEFLMENEYFDGEIVYASPFRCRTCHDDLCSGPNGDRCQRNDQLCTKHSAQYQRRFGRAANE